METGKLRLVKPTDESDAREREMFGETHAKFRAECPNVNLDDPRDALMLAMGLLSDMQDRGATSWDRRTLNRVKWLIDGVRVKLPRG